MGICAAVSGKSLTGLALALALSMTPVAAEKDLPQDDPADQETSGKPQADAKLSGLREGGRFMLVEVEDGVLRVDRQKGSVSLCRRANGNWRCNPVPQAEDAYIAEINALAAEVDRLTARLKDIETVESETAPAGDTTQTPDAKGLKGLSEEDEMELERMLSFTEDAMRRFFGLVRSLRDDLEAKNGSQE